MTRIILISIFLINIAYAQELLRENIGSSGNSKIIGKNYISQSIGQQSAITSTVSNNNISLRQGFQQPVFKVERNILPADEELDLVVFPNPFRYDIGVHFDQAPLEQVNVSIYDTKGRIIKDLSFNPQIDLIIPCKELASGSYVLKIISSNKKYSANIIKQ